MSACFGLTQGDVESEYNTPFFFLLYFLLFSFFQLTCVHSDGYHEIFVQNIPIFHDAAIPSIARRFCQEDPYYSVSSVNPWRTRDDIL